VLQRYNFFVFATYRFQFSFVFFYFCGEVEERQIMIDQIIEYNKTLWWRKPSASAESTAPASACPTAAWRNVSRRAARTATGRTWTSSAAPTSNAVT
jgi:hypothetical protein